jgi:hypothetical protein
VRVCLDECLDWHLAKHLPGHDVRTVAQMGWSSFENGELLARVSTQFDVFVTVDKNLPHQQSIGKLPLAVFVLDSRWIRLVDILPLVPNLMKALENPKSRTVTVITAD